MLEIDMQAGTEANIAEMCRLYWAQPERPTEKRPFLYSTDELGRRFGFSRIAVGRVVEQHCFAYDPTRLCKTCGKPLQMYKREDYAFYRYGERECRNCTAPRAAAFHAELQDGLRMAVLKSPDDAVLKNWLRAGENHAAQIADRERKRHKGLFE
jgi:hypothetical protein